MMPTETTEKLARAGLNLIQQALSIFGHDLRLLLSNDRYQQMFDLPDHLARPGACFEDTIRFLVMRGEYGPLIDPDGAVRTRVEAARAFQPHYMERQRANGRWISVEGAPLPQGGWVTVYTDITEIKLQEGLLRARSEELSDQLVAHAQRLSLANRELAAMNTALQEAKRELTEIEARTRLTTEMMPAHIAHLDRRLVYTYSNRRLSTIMPGVPSDMIGLHARDALGESTFAQIAPAMGRALAGESSVVEITHEDSGRRLRVALTPDPGLPDDPVLARGGGVYILSTDITEEAQARAALMQTRKRELAAHLTSGLAHDFANLLTIILGLQERLARLPGLPGEAAELARSTTAAARRGGALLQRIGSISGQRDLHLEPTDIARLLEDMALMARPTLPEGQRLELRVEPDLPELMLDQGAVQDSLLNLILNARDALGRHGAITVSARRVRDTWLEFRVEDDGPGFTPEALKRGMDPFFTTKGGEGSGLGLAMVFDHASLSGGSLRLANREGGGARVTLRLPFRVGSERRAPVLVLLVEDSPELRIHVRELLRALGHTVIEAATAAEARAIATLDGIGFVLSDIQLAGGETGLSLLDGLGARLPGVAMGLMTSLPPGDPRHVQAATRHPVLRKPFSQQQLQAFLDACRAGAGTLAPARVAGAGG